MHLEIVSPEAVLFSGEVTSVAVPGITGEFQVLDNHAPVVSLLGKGNVTVHGNIELDKAYADRFKKVDGATQLSIDSGVLEMKDNKVIVLAD